jgi:hypothetical protein
MTWLVPLLHEVGFARHGPVTATEITNPAVASVGAHVASPERSLALMGFSPE